MIRRFIRMGIGRGSGNNVSQPLFVDTFTGANGTSLADHDPDTDVSGNGWTLRERIITIQNNRASGSGLSTTTYLATFDGTVSDGVITCKLSAEGGETSYIVLRYTDNTHMWRVGIRKSTGTFRILKVDGTASVVAETIVAGGIVAETQYTVNVQFSGQSIIATLNGANQIEVTDAALNVAATVHGLRLSGTGTADDLLLEGQVPPSQSPVALAGWEGDDWTLIHLPDSQLLLESYPAMFDAQMQYVADNEVTANIQMVLHSGDIVETRTEVVEQEWTDADEAVDILDAANVPYLLAHGNHDWDNRGDSDLRDLTHFNATFPQSRYTTKDWWAGGFYEEGHSENAYLLRTISGKDYVFITLEEFPRDAVLTWLDGLLTTYAAREAIIITHAYLGLDSTLILTGESYGPQENAITDQNDAGAIWTVIKAHDNVVLVLSGHIMDGAGLGSVRLISYSDGNYSVHQIASTYHMPTDVQNSGYLRKYKIRPSLGKIEVTTYSPAIDASLTGAADQFVLDYRLRKV